MRIQNAIKQEQQHCLFPVDLDSNTEFWLDWQGSEIVAMQKAMLVQALSEIKDKRKSRKMREEAWEWLFSDEDHSFSAPQCASTNALDIQKLRFLTRRAVGDHI